MSLQKYFSFFLRARGAKKSWSMSLVTVANSNEQRDPSHFFEKHGKSIITRPGRRPHLSVLAVLHHKPDRVVSANSNQLHDVRVVEQPHGVCKSNKRISCGHTTRDVTSKPRATSVMRRVINEKKAWQFILAFWYVDCD